MKIENSILSAFAQTLLFFTVFCFVFIASTFGQTSATATAIKGSVSNSAGEAIAGAAIVLRDTATNQTRETKTQNDGTFQIRRSPTADLLSAVCAQAAT